MFLGNYTRKVNGDGKITIPNDFKDLFDPDIVYQVLEGGALTIYCFDEWMKLATGQLERTSHLERPKEDEIRKAFFDNSFYCFIEGKILKLHPEFRKGLENVTLSGQGKFIEVTAA